MLLGLLWLSACQSADPFGLNQNTTAITTGPITSAPSTSAIFATPKELRLRPGDVINVFVFDNPDLSHSVTIGPDGKFRYPLIGEVSANGRTLREMEQTLTERLGQNILLPQVSVSLSDLRSYRIYVNGEVLRPGMFELDGPVTVVQALTMAGGFTAFASRDNIIVYNPMKGSGTRRDFNYDQFLNTPGAQDIVVQPGDTIIVR